jgi:hypothetical protein
MCSLEKIAFKKEKKFLQVRSRSRSRGIYFSNVSCTCSGQAAGPEDGSQALCRHKNSNHVKRGRTHCGDPGHGSTRRAGLSYTVNYSSGTRSTVVGRS